MKTKWNFLAFWLLLVVASPSWAGVHTHIPRGVNAANDTVEADAGDQFIAAKAELDTTDVDSIHARALVTTGKTTLGDAPGDTLALTGQKATGNPHFYGNIQIDRATSLAADLDSLVLVIQDTTVTGVSVYRIEGYNLHNPNQMGKFVPAGGGKMRLVSAYDDYRMRERNTSIVRTEGKTHPDWGVKIITAGKDSLVTVDGKDHSRPFVFVGGASNAILDATPVMTSISTQDGRDWVSGTGGADWTLIDWWADGVYQWDTANYSQYKGLITNRNAGRGWLALATSPVIVNASVNDGAVIRDTWPFHRDNFGRQLAYWSTATPGGVSADSWNNTSTMSIFDSGDTATSILMLEDGSINSIQDDATRDNLRWTYRTQAITADSWTQNETWSNTGTGSADLRWSDATIFSDVAAIPGASSAGRNSPRIMLGTTTQGLALIDAKAGDNTNGGKVYIDTGFSTGLMYGNVPLAFSPASSANLGNLPAIFSTAESSVTRTLTTNGPTSHRWEFGGNSVSRIPDHDSLSIFDGSADSPFSISWWMYQTSGSVANEVIISKGGTDGKLEYLVSLNGSGYLNWSIYDASASDQITIARAIEFPVEIWIFCAVTYDGSGSTDGMEIFLNGNNVGKAIVVGGTIIATENLTGPLTIGKRYQGTFYYSGGLEGYISPPVFSRGIPPKSVLQAEFARGEAAINSPTTDVLTSSDVLRVKASDDGKYWGVLNTSRVEIRATDGTLVDTLACTQCGTLADFAWAPIPTNPYGVYMGGSTGYRSVIPDVRVEALAQHEWQDHSVIFDAEQVVVDSAGTGDFWRIGDAVSAISVVGKRLVRVLEGTYPDPFTIASAATIEGSGIKTLVTNANSTGDEPMTVSGDTVQVRDMAFRSATGGAGGNQDAVLWSGSHGIAENLKVIDADDDAFTITGRFNRFINSLVVDSDDRGFSFEGGRNSAITPVISSGGSSAVFVAAGDSCRVSGGDLSGNIHAASGATRNIILGTIFGALEDWGTSTMDSGNP